MARPPTSPLGAIGNTPVVKLQKVVPPGCADVYVKLESFNPTGSYKDRMAKSMIDEAEKRGALKSGMIVTEATGGSTGSSLAFVCAAKGYKFHVISSNAYAQEKLKSMRALGAQLEIVESPSGLITSDLFRTMDARAQDLAKREEYYYTDQFNNRDALSGYAEIGEELVEQFPDGMDLYCGAVGTAGMIAGVSSVLRPKWPQTKIVVFEPTSSPVISGGVAGTHSVDGIAVGSVPPHLRKGVYDDVVAIEESEAREMCRRLAREEGLLVGTSAGLNIVGAMKLAKKLGPGKKVVTVACDTGLKYLNGDLYAKVKPKL